MEGGARGPVTGTVCGWYAYEAGLRVDGDNGNVTLPSFIFSATIDDKYCCNGGEILISSYLPPPLAVRPS